MTPEQLNEKKIQPLWVALLPCIGLFFLFMPRGSQSDLTRAMAINQKLGETVPVNLPFTDEYGKSVKFGQMLQGRPVVVVPIFYSCKTGCAILTDNIMKTLAKATKGDILKPGRDLDVVMVSIDPKEDANLAHAKKALIFNSLTPNMPNPADSAKWRMETEKGWHLLTGSLDSVKKLCESIGFHYVYRAVPDLEKRNTIWLINHPTCTAMLTPNGKISSYTIGNDFQTKEVEGDLVVAQSGAVGRHTDQSWMFGCIMIDPATGKNRVVIENIWRLGGLLTLAALAISITSMSLKGKRDNLKSEGGQSLR